MKYLVRLFYFLIFSLTVACDEDFSGGITLDHTPDEEYINITYRISFDEVYESSRAGAPENLAIPIPNVCNLVIYLYYEGELLEVAKMLGNNNILYTTHIPYIKPDPDYLSNRIKFIGHFPKRWDPSKIEFRFLATSIPNSNFSDQDFLFDLSGKNPEYDLYIRNKDLKNDKVYYQNFQTNYFLKESLSDVNDWNKAKKEFLLKRLECRIVVLSDEFFNFPETPDNSPLFSAISLSKNENNNPEDFACRQFYLGNNSNEKKLGMGGYYYVPNKIKGLIDTSAPFSMVTKKSWGTDAGGIINHGGKMFNVNDPTPIPTSPNSSILFKGRQMAAIVEFDLLSASPSIPTYPIDNAGSEYRYLYIWANSSDSNVSQENIFDKPDLFVDTTIPLPEGGLKQGKLYIYYNKPNTRIFNSYKITYNNYNNHPSYEPIYYSALSSTRSKEKFIIEEYDMDEPLPFEVK